jgi:DNA-binding MarR family transcriptional regulator
MERPAGPVETAAPAGAASPAGGASPASPAAGPAAGPAGPAAGTGPSTPAQAAEVASALNSGAIHLLRSLAAVDRESGLPRARLSALSVLVFGGSRTLGELAAAEGVAGPTMTRIVDGLIAEHLAERLPHPTDGRAVVIAATEAGETLMRMAQRRRIDTLVTAVAGLPLDQQLVLAAAGPLLDRLAAVVRGQPASEG